MPPSLNLLYNCLSLALHCSCLSLALQCTTSSTGSALQGLHCRVCSTGADTQQATPKPCHIHRRVAPYTKMVAGAWEKKGVEVEEGMGESER